jgi:TetR/AcrR family transcriptional repressor of nem operon
MYARGGTAVGVDEIGRPAGVHKGSFYHFFPSKQALVLAVLAMYRQHIREPLGGGQAGRLPPAGALPAGVCTCLSCALSVLPGQRTAGWVPAGQPGTGARKSGPRRAAEAARHVYRVGVCDRARRAGGMASGALPTLDPGTTAQIVVAYFEGVMMSV